MLLSWILALVCISSTSSLSLGTKPLSSLIRRPFHSVVAIFKQPSFTENHYSRLLMSTSSTSSETKSGKSKRSGIRSSPAGVAGAVCLFSVGLNQLLAYYSANGNASYQFLLSLGIGTIALQWLVFFVHASGLLFGNERTEKYYDLTGASTFILSTLMSTLVLGYNSLSHRQIILTGFVLCWAGRLGSFLYDRVCKHNGIDSRFTEMKKNLGRFLVAWTLQGVWVFITALPVFALNSMPDMNPTLSRQDFVGFFLWITGFLIEVTADHQKSVWRADTANKDKFIDVGVWKWSRHPNYFGEILLWIGVFLSASNAFNTTQKIACLSSPVFVALLLIFVSGIPLLEKASDAKFGKIGEYQTYVENTPVLIPFIGRKGRANF